MKRVAVDHHHRTLHTCSNPPASPHRLYSPRLRVQELAVVLREHLVKPKKEVLRCISDMVVGLGPPFHERVLDMLDIMLRSGLTPDLIDTLAVVAAQLTTQQDVIQKKLMAEVFKILGWTSHLTHRGRAVGEGNDTVIMQCNAMHVQAHIYAYSRCKLAHT